MLSRLETFANPHDAPSDNMNKRGLRHVASSVGRKDVGQERRDRMFSEPSLVYVCTDLPYVCVCLYICVCIRLVSHGAALPCYLRMTCLIIGRCAAASENFNDVLIHARGAIASSDREREFSWLGGRHSFTVEVGFSPTSARSYRLSWNSMDSRVRRKT